jgi:hypothetical protein
LKKRKNNHRQGKKATAEVEKNKKTTLAVAFSALPIVVFFSPANSCFFQPCQ